MYCKKCGNQVDDTQKFCPYCGEAQTQTEAAGETVNAEPIAEPVFVAEEPKKERSLNVGMLVWSILNMVFCCVPFGIVGLVMTILSKTADTDEDSESKIKKAKTFNLLSTILGAVFVVFYFIFVFMLALFGMEANMYF